MTAAALVFGVVAMVASILSTLGMMFCDEQDDRRHGEYTAIGWMGVAALMWLVAK